ncbi:MAG: aminotransferase class I/II-fold pyridoxal phosphate-dependent enzyme [Planctomycetes bacterium]|nr:aminotransferase class I/II-fold pyridoxal phosphate-dependent enzyme [Planctomycetota bacterium]
MQIRTFLVERWMSTYENDIRFNLAESSIKQLTLDELLSLAEQNGAPDIRRRMHRLVLTYDETRGTRELREAIATHYPGATAENVLVTNGAIEANYLLFHTLVRPGDTVITPFPAYQQLYSVAEAIGANVKHWEIKEENGYVPDVADLDALLDDRTRLIVVNTPHNPTGGVFTEEQVRAVFARAEEIGARVLSDETYQGISLDEKPLCPPAYSLSDKMISVCTASKNLGLAGLRIGWIVADADLVQRCWHYRDYTSISSGRLSDFLALIAVKHRPQLIERACRIARKNFQVADAFMQSHAELFHYIPPRAGLLMFPRLKRTRDSVAFCRDLIKEQGVLLVPGQAFEKEGYIRMGYGDDIELLQEGLERFDRHLKARV